MNITRILLLPAILFSTSTVFPCSTVGLFRSGEKLVGKAFEWHNAAGWAVVNPRGLVKRSLALKSTDKPTEPWTAKYGSLTFNQHGAEFPLGGINEAGLTVEIMSGGDKDMVVDSRPSFNEVQWIQYQLDNFADVRDLVANVSKHRISRIVERVHYMACDRSGMCAVIEPFFTGDFIVHLGADVSPRVLTNSLYTDSVAHLRKHIGFGGTLPIPSSMDSLDRFVRASSLALKYPSLPSALGAGYVFEILRSVALSPQWQLVYDLESRRVQFRTNDSPSLKTVQGAKFRYDCRNPRSVFHMNQQVGGDVTTQFEMHTPEVNAKMIKAGTLGLDNLPPGVVDAFAAYPFTVKCTQ